MRKDAAYSPLRRRSFVSLLLALAGIGALVSCWSWVAHAQPAQCRALGSAELNRLERSYSLGDIRVFWTELPPDSGTDHRLAERSRVDANDNSVPDFIENIARQADVARQAFSYMGFRDPLDSPKYQNVQYIDINVLTMPYNGRAYDSAVYYPDAPGRGSACTLRIDISSQLETRLIGRGDNRRLANFTDNWFVVAHEMFHLFQYGLTQFKRAWINEPTAKWAEYALRRGDFYPPGASGYSLPPTLEKLEEYVIRKPISVSANRFWSRLIELADPFSNRLVLPPSLLAYTYTDGRPVIKDEFLRGAPVIVAIFETLGIQDSQVSKTEGWMPYAWHERNQTSAAHDSRLLCAIHAVIQDLGVWARPERVESGLHESCAFK